jgi:hypothetical protein
MQLICLLRIPHALPTTFLNLIVLIGEVYKSLNFFACISRLLSVTSSTLAPNSTQTAGHFSCYPGGGPRLISYSRMFVQCIRSYFCLTNADSNGEYNEKAIKNIRQGVVFQLEVWATC